MRAAAVMAGAVMIAVPAALAQTVAPGRPDEPAAARAAVRAAALDAAAGWRDWLDAYRAPGLPTPSDAESAILLLAAPPASAAPPGERAAAALSASEGQDALVPVLESLGATITFRYRVLVNAIGVRVPAGRLEALAALPEVAAVVPVAFLAPAQVPEYPTAPSPAGPGAAPAVAGPGSRPAHLALIDAGVDASHPWLGGGIGPTFPIIGGADLVDRDQDPSASPADPAAEAHGTQLAGLVLRSPALQGLPPERVPRLLAYRVVAREPVGGRLRPLARTDRLLAALEAAVDPDGDGDPADRAEVILMGLASGFDAGGLDPVREALAAADRVGSTVVVPAGNDGPTFARPGSVGAPAATPTAIAVGGLSAGSGPRTADLRALLGPAEAALGPLPLMGPEPAGDPLMAVVLRGPAGMATGAAPEDYRGPDGASRVTGALAVVARGGGSIPELARQAAAAGAAALAVWDEAGPSSFPAAPGDGGLPIPVVGLGRSQGEALERVVSSREDLRVALAARPDGEAPVAVASFSSWGPTADGRQKPDLVAPAVARQTAWPGRGPDGLPAAVPLTGTSAAAAEVAAIALRLRVDRPALGPRAVHSLLVQSARPLPGVSSERQGAGIAVAPREPRLRLEPPIPAVEPADGRGLVRAVLTDLSGVAGRYVVVLVRRSGEVPLGGGIELEGDGRAVLRLPLPDAGDGRLVVREAATGADVGSWPVVASRPARTPAGALGEPEVRVASGLAEALVRVGTLRRQNARVEGVRLHGLRLELVPAEGGEPLPVAGAKQEGAWPAGTYRFLLARRLASGLDVPPGAYRLRATAAGPDGRRVSAESRRFALVGPP